MRLHLAVLGTFPVPHAIPTRARSPLLTITRSFSKTMGSARSKWFHLYKPSHRSSSRKNGRSTSHGVALPFCAAHSGFSSPRSVDHFEVSAAVHGRPVAIFGQRFLSYSNQPVANLVLLCVQHFLVVRKPALDLG